MFTTDEAVNYILNASKMIVDEINKDKNCPKELKEIQYLIFAGMVAYYGYEYIELIHNAFKKTNFVYTNQSFKDHAKEINYSNPTVDKLIATGEVGAFVKCSFSKDFRGKFYIGRDIYVIDNYREAADFFLEKIIHEVNHVVNSMNNPIVLYKGLPSSRTGMYVSCIEKDDTSFGNLFEEDYNVLQSAEIMEHILEFTQYEIQDPDIRRALDKIKYAYGSERSGIGYQGTVEVFRDLYENAHFRCLVKRERLSGDVKKVRLDFDDRCGEGSFYTFCGLLDNLEVCGANFYEKMYYEGKVKEFIKKYNSN